MVVRAPQEGFAQVMVAEDGVVVASMSCSLSLVVPGGGVLVRGVFRRRRERRRNRAGGQPGGPGGEDVFQRAKGRNCAGAAGPEGDGPRPGKRSWLSGASAARARL